MSKKERAVMLSPKKKEREKDKFGECVMMIKKRG